MSSLPDAAQFSAPGPPSLREPDAALFVERLQALGSRALVANVEAEAFVERAGRHARDGRGRPAAAPAGIRSPGGPW